MKYMIIVKHDGQNTNLHETIIDLMDCYRFDLDTVFFTGKGASLLSDVYRGIFESYKKKAALYDVKLLVCSRALDECGIDTASLVDGIEISGYTELAVSISRTKKVVSF